MTVAPPSPAQATLQLHAIDNRLVAAQGMCEPAFLETLVGHDFLLTDSDGDWLEREEFLARQREPARFVDVAREDVDVRLFGVVAVVHGVLRCRRRGEETERLRTTDAYAWQDGRWRLVGMQRTSINPNAAVAASVAAPAIVTPWRGTDPQGDDFAVLAALNAQYVQAFRDADAAWYDAHLAPDYELVPGDGSRLQRAAALSDFAVPHFARHIADFPLDKVRIRRFGELALIHAENAYTLQDGRKGVNRYTDIWMKHGGHWWCIAAHITVREPPE